MVGSGVEKRPLPAKAMKVPTSFMMSWRPAFRMEVRLALLPTWALARLARVTVAGLRVEGHIADATLGLCLRAWLKMTTGGEVGSREKWVELEASGSDSVCVPFIQVTACCLRVCRPSW